jgi:hypothetical protein
MIKDTGVNSLMSVSLTLGGGSAAPTITSIANNELIPIIVLNSTVSTPHINLSANRYFLKKIQTINSKE